MVTPHTVHAATLTASNYEIEVYPDGPGEDERATLPTIKLVYAGDVDVEIIYEEGSRHWGALAFACDNNVAGPEYKVPLQPHAGSGCERWITVCDDVVTFALEKTGDGMGGEIRLRVPARTCVAAFLEAEKITRDWIKSAAA